LYVNIKLNKDYDKMAKKANRNTIKMVSELNNGLFYVTTKNKKSSQEKLKLKKYDKKAKKHVYFVEKKMK